MSQEFPNESREGLGKDEPNPVAEKLARVLGAESQDNIVEIDMGKIIAWWEEAKKM